MTELEAIYRSIAGGTELLDWFGFVPSFHDGEIIKLELNRRTTSTLMIHSWIARKEVDQNGHFALDKHAIVAFNMTGISDLQLDGFSQQNVIGSLNIKRPGRDPERWRYYDFNSEDNAFEIELEPCCGMDGRIRCNALEIKLTPGKPSDTSARN